MGPVVAVVGGGQLARMMAAPAGALDIHVRALVEADDGAAAQVLPDAPVGAADDEEALTRVTRGAQVLTFEHEHVPYALLAGLEADGVAVRPGSRALRAAQDKIHMRRVLTELGVPCPRWAEVNSVADLAAFGDEIGWPVVLKRPVGGYDGKGVRIVHSAQEGADWAAEGALAEETVDFRSELAALLARRPSGQVQTWTTVQTTQVGGVCSEVISPAPDLEDDGAGEAARIARTIAEGLDVTGVLAVEMFHTRDGRLLVNELAMRPHNSGHVTIDATVTSQFEQHLRAVLDLPLGRTEQLVPWAVMVNVLGSQLADPTKAYPELMERYPEAKVHLYGKSVRPGRKLGHVTVTGDDLPHLRRVARAAADLLEGR
ncbi:5-(carboxyamino)imidazole ribonucleotide synthase [Pseudactinotalea sp. Z1732]|uniref:5-(carboxyamino)imidazole ribonucleotide synthase n=1 Tax=Pseudactinotalea sp. Z1732 TaxID=3413026 RepID=UPI003C79B2D3